MHTLWRHSPAHCRITPTLMLEGLDSGLLVATSDQLTTCPIFLSAGTLKYRCLACDETLPTLMQCSGGWNCPTKAFMEASVGPLPRRRLPSPGHAAERQSSRRTTQRDPVTFKGQFSAAGCIRSAGRIKAGTFLAPRRHGGGGGGGSIL